MAGLPAALLIMTAYPAFQSLKQRMGESSCAAMPVAHKTKFSTLFGLSAFGVKTGDKITGDGHSIRTDKIIRDRRGATRTRRIMLFAFGKPRFRRQALSLKPTCIREAYACRFQIPCGSIPV